MPILQKIDFILSPGAEAWCASHRKLVRPFFICLRLNTKTMEEWWSFDVFEYPSHLIAGHGVFFCSGGNLFCIPKADMRRVSFSSLALDIVDGYPQIVCRKDVKDFQQPQSTCGVGNLFRIVGFLITGWFQRSFSQRSTTNLLRDVSIDIEIDESTVEAIKARYAENRSSGGAKIWLTRATKKGTDRPIWVGEFIDAAAHTAIIKGCHFVVNDIHFYVSTPRVDEVVRELAGQRLVLQKHDAPVVRLIDKSS